MPTAHTHHIGGHKLQQLEHVPPPAPIMVSCNAPAVSSSVEQRNHVPRHSTTVQGQGRVQGHTTMTVPRSLMIQPSQMTLQVPTQSLPSHQHQQLQMQQRQIAITPNVNQFNMPTNNHNAQIIMHQQSLQQQIQHHNMDNDLGNNAQLTLMSNNTSPVSEPMLASSISVSATTYAPPPLHSSSLNSSLVSLKREIEPSTTSTNTPPRKKHCRLAAVPTNKLSLKSIISLNSKSYPLTAKSASTNNVVTVAHRNERIDVEASGDMVNVKAVAVTMLSQQQQRERSRSSFSSACDATLQAQHQLQRNLLASTSGTCATDQQSESSFTSTSTSAPTYCHDKLRQECITMSLESALQQGKVGDVSVIPPIAPLAKSCHSSETEVSSVESDGNSSSVAPSQPQTHKGNTKIHLNAQVVEKNLQGFFGNLLQTRGYSNQYYCSLEGAYYCKPTVLQKASHGMKIIQAVRTSDEKLLERLLSAGISPNPCNAFGESILHMVCRRGDFKLLKIFIKHGCSIQVSDDFGRTPLHDACWTDTPCFKSVELLLNKDIRLLHIVDCRGSSPLAYVRRGNYSMWADFFDSHKELWWPERSILKDGQEEPPKLVSLPPHSMPVANPPNALCPEKASMISSGKCDPENINL